MYLTSCVCASSSYVGRSFVRSDLLSVGSAADCIPTSAVLKGGMEAQSAAVPMAFMQMILFMKQLFSDGFLQNVHAKM